MTGLSPKGETNTKNTMETTNKDYLSINQGKADKDRMDTIEIYTQIVKENIDYPYGLVKGKFLKLDSGHIRYVMDSMEKTTSHIVNIKAYLLTALYNAPNTISNYYSNYYSAEVNYYEYGNGRNEV